MGKAKKGKRADKDEDFDSTVEVEEPVAEESKSKKKKEKKKKKEADDIDNLVQEIGELKVEPKGKASSKKNKKTKKRLSESESEAEVSVKGKPESPLDSDEEVVTSKQKGKIVAKSFALLALESDKEEEEEVTEPVAKVHQKKGKKSKSYDSDDNEGENKNHQKGKRNNNSVESDNEDEDNSQKSKEKKKENKGRKNSEYEEDVKKTSQEEPTKSQEVQGKKGKKKKARKDIDEEDIEKVLAELEMEYNAGPTQKKSSQLNVEKILDSEEPKTKEKVELEIKGKDKTEESKDSVKDEESSGIKTAAQKKKEKKEREKEKKRAQKLAEATKKTDTKEPTKPVQPETAAEVANVEAKNEDEETGKKKKEKDVKGGKGPGKKTILAMQEALRKVKEEEERLKREEEEKIRQEELREQARLEQLRIEQEKKEKKKLKEKQRKERLKKEGKFLSEKQKKDRARAQEMLEALKAKGFELPDAAEKKPLRAGTRLRPYKLKSQTSTESKEETKSSEDVGKENVQVEIVDNTGSERTDKKEEKEEVVKDAWDAETSEEEPEEDKSEEPSKQEEREASENETESGTGSDSDSEDESEESDEEDKKTEADRKKEKAKLRIQNRRLEAEKKLSLNDLRAGVVCVLGHVDTGKTKILDKLRRTNVQDSEAGGITQQIGATNVPIEAIQKSARFVKGFNDKKLKIPGLLIIDTPGHESFSNLRNRGSSLCDIAILVVDIMHGLEPQTIESINLLKAKKCPFVVALNKIDRLYEWVSYSQKDVEDIIAEQSANTQREFEKRSQDVIVQLAEQGLNSALYYKNPDPRTYVSLVPTSAITGEGMGNLLSLIVDACQGPLAKRLMYSEELQATVLEVKALPGLGTTIDCILVNGTLREGETMLLAGTDGPIITQIRSLLMPQPLKELRVKNAYIEHREVKAAQGVKIAAKDLEKAIAGLNIMVAQHPDEVEVLKEEISKELSHALGKIKLAERGVFVQASTLGALEALLDFLKSSKIPYAGIRIGPVVKKDVMKASIMLEHDSQYATILAFDVKIERDAQELADSLGVKIFQADIIYHLFDKFTNYREELKQRKREEHKHIAVFPCKLKVLPQHIFNSRDPIVMGIMVEAGILKEGTPVCVPSKDFVDLGIVTSIEYNHKPVETARKGQEVCIKIEPVPGEAPKMFGRHFDEKDLIVSKVSRQSIDACKEYFRDDLVKTDWALMIELKKLFQIL